MSKEPKDTEEQSKSSASAPSSSEINSEQDQTESSETAREVFMRLISGNPTVHSSEAIWKSIRDRRSEAIEWESGCIRDPINNATTR